MKLLPESTWRLAFAALPLFVVQLTPWFGGISPSLEKLSHFQWQAFVGVWFILAVCLFSRKSWKAGLALLLPMTVGVIHLFPYWGGQKRSLRGSGDIPPRQLGQLQRAHLE